MLAQFPDATLCPSCAPPRWGQLEDPFVANSYCGADDIGGIRAVVADSGVVFAAGESVNYYRGMERKPAYRYTGSAALVLAELTGTSALAASGQASQLPVRDGPEAAFARALRSVVRPNTMVVDLKGMRARSFDIAVGTGPRPDERARHLAAEIARAGQSRGLAVAVNEPFVALPPWTVTRFVQTQLHASGVQVQLSTILREPCASPLYAQLALSTLRAGLAAL